MQALGLLCGRLMAARCRPLVESVTAGVGMPLAGEYQPCGVLPAHSCCWRCPTAWPGDIWHYRLSLAAGVLRAAATARAWTCSAALTGGLLFGREWRACLVRLHSPPDSGGVPAVGSAWASNARQSKQCSPRRAAGACLGLATGPDAARLVSRERPTFVACWSWSGRLGAGRNARPAARLGMICGSPSAACVGLGARGAADFPCFFLQFLPQAFIGGHDGAFGHGCSAPGSRRFLLCSRPTHSGRDLCLRRQSGLLLVRVWGNVGGYVDLRDARPGRLRPRQPPRLGLAGCCFAWICIVTVAKTFGVCANRRGLGNDVPGVAPICLLSLRAAELGTGGDRARRARVSMR